MLSRIFIMFFSFSYICVSAQQEDSMIIRKIADDVLTNGKAYENLRILCKTVGGRLAGSPQMYKAEDWGKQVLQTAGADKIWLQQCKVPRWSRGGKDEAYFIENSKKRSINILALGNSIGTASKGLLAPVIAINSFEE
ncbi:MAG: peptidase M28 family protein, partial [Flavitalea sp.]